MIKVKVLNTLVRSKFGKHYSIQLNSLNFISNRTGNYYFYNCSEIILVKSNKQVLISQLIQIKEYLMLNIIFLLMFVDSECFMKVTDIEVVIF